MLRIYEIALTMAADAAAVAEEIEKRDADLARQMRRAVQSAVLNLAEGMANSSGHKRQRYQTALGSARETLACVEVAQAMRYIGTVEPNVLDRMNHVVATLTRLVYRRA
jgi:four helix bundle protein